MVVFLACSWRRIRHQCRLNLCSFGSGACGWRICDGRERSILYEEGMWIGVYRHSVLDLDLWGRRVQVHLQKYRCPVNKKGIISRSLGRAMRWIGREAGGVAQFIATSWRAMSSTRHDVTGRSTQGLADHGGIGKFSLRYSASLTAESWNAHGVTSLDACGGVRGRELLDDPGMLFLFPVDDDDDERTFSSLVPLPFASDMEWPGGRK